MSEVRPPEEPRPHESLSWRVAAVVLGALHALVALVLPARGLTFLWDDWMFLGRFANEPWPARWFARHNEHWFPIFVATFDLEHLALGVHHDAYLVANWCLHVVNLWLLARLLGSLVKDDRAGALATLAFGVATSYRDVLWWAEVGGIAIAFAAIVTGFLALERSRAAARAGRSLAVAAIATFAAPISWSPGIALGPALLVDEWLARGARRRGALAAIGGAWIAYLALLALLGKPAGALPRTGDDALAAAAFLARGIGLGIVRESWLVPASDGVPGIALTLALYAGIVLGGWFTVAARGRFVALQALLVFLVAPVALVRWSLPERTALWSRYQYMPGIAWSAALAPLVALGLAKRPRLTTGAAVVVLALLALGHARLARDDRRLSAPEPRRVHVLFVERLVAATTRARGPVYDAPLPFYFSGPIPLRAREVVRVYAPSATVAWTEERTEASTEPYRRDEFLRPLAD